MDCLVTTRIAGPCAGCGASVQEGLHLMTTAAGHTFYCAACCPVHGKHSATTGVAIAIKPVATP